MRYNSIESKETMASFSVRNVCAWRAILRKGTSGNIATVYRPNNLTQAYHTSNILFRVSSTGDKFINSDNVSAVINQLDANMDDDEDLRRAHSQRRLKLNKSLLKPPKKVLDPASRGVYDALGDEIADTMNDFLIRNNIFPVNVRRRDRTSVTAAARQLKSDQVVEISTVSLNQDQSHAHAYWSSPPVEILLDSMLISSKQFLMSRHDLLPQRNVSEEESQIEARSPAENLHLAKRMIAKLSEKLQGYEGKFRSNIIRTINMRRVPRVFFAPDEETKKKLEQLKNMAELQQN